jgi:hypothetical protein
MKKFGKFIFGTLTVATIAAGAYYLYKNFIKKDSSDDFDDFEDDFEDFDTEEESDNESREYVPINIAPEASTAEASEELTDEDEKEAETEDGQ